MKTKTLITSMMLMGVLLANAQDRLVSTDQLPRDAAAWVSSNFRSASITTVEKDYDDGRTFYEVILSDGTEIDFFENGDWKEVDGKQNPLPTGFINKSIINHITRNHPDVKIKKVEKEARGYEVELSNGRELKFNAKGKFTGFDN